MSVVKYRHRHCGLLNKAKTAGAVWMKDQQDDVVD